MRIASWNVNGLRAVAGKGFGAWLDASGADVVCLQEIKAKPEQLPPELLAPAGYQAYWQPARRPGYSGTAALVRRRAGVLPASPPRVEPLGQPAFDDEGRVQLVRLDGLTVANAYFPNSQEGGARLGYKLAFCAALAARLDALVAAGERVVLTGDYNIAHQPIDLARPEDNEASPGYLPEERAWMSAFLASGWVDTFRRQTAEGGHYTWWSYRTRARERNIGWRLDYFCVDPALAGRVRRVGHQADVLGSDHCPLLLDLDP